MMGLGSLVVLLASVAIASEGIRTARHKQNASLVGDSEDDMGTPQTQVVPALTQEVSMSDIEPECTCSFARYSWQQWPTESGGAGCIGGCGGGEFQIDRYGRTIRTIAIWFNGGNSNDYIRAIRVTYEDGHAEEVGGREGSARSFTFKVGEWVVGDLRLSGNGIGTRLGSIAFDTNLGNKFDVGKRDPTRFYFPTGGTASRPVHLAGLSGAGGSDIDRLGVIFWKPISSTTYLSINYPTLEQQSRLTVPTQVDLRAFCNDGPCGVPTIEKKETEIVVTGSEHCLTTSLETQFTYGLTLTGSVPFIKEAQYSAEWSLNAAVGTNNCWSETRTKNTSLVYPVFTIPPYTRVRQIFQQWSGILSSLPFTATLRVTTTDGTTFNRNEEGVYNGVRYNTEYLSYSWDPDPVAPGECSNLERAPAPTPCVA